MTLIYYVMVVSLTCATIGQSPTLVVASDSEPTGPRKDGLSSGTGKERLDRCVASIPPPVEMNMAWVLSVKKWYVTHVNQRDYARYLSVLWTGGKGDSCLSTSLCRTLTVLNETYMTYAHCNGIQIGTSFNLSYKDGKGNDLPGIESWTSFTQNGDKDWSGTSTPVKTDNKTYGVYFRCWEDGSQGFAVLSSRPQLPSATLKDIRTFIDDSAFCPWQRVTTYSPFVCSD